MNFSDKRGGEINSTLPLNKRLYKTEVNLKNNTKVECYSIAVTVVTVVM